VELRTPFRRMRYFAIKRFTMGPQSSTTTSSPMSTDANSSSPTQTISERRRANLEMAAQEAFPGTAQSELRVNFLDVLLAIAQGFSATNKQLDKFLVHTKNERICAIANCGQRFKRRDRSRDHIRVHLDDRPYACDGECGKPGW